jgi:hypothetical protein
MLNNICNSKLDFKTTSSGNATVKYIQQQNIIGVREGNSSWLFRSKPPRKLGPQNWKSSKIMSKTLNQIDNLFCWGVIIPCAQCAPNKTGGTVPCKNRFNRALPLLKKWCYKITLFWCKNTKHPKKKEFWSSQSH